MTSSLTAVYEGNAHESSLRQSSSCGDTAIAIMQAARFVAQVTLSIEAAHNFKLVATHITSGENNVVDDLHVSRDNLHSFFFQGPNGQQKSGARARDSSGATTRPAGGLDLANLDASFHH